MNFARLSSLLEYVTELVKKYNELENIQKRTIYRIADINSSLPNKVTIIVQFIGKSTFFHCTPEEIVADDKFLEGFSKKDIRTIIYFAHQETKNPKYKIISQDFCDERNKLLFKLKCLENDKVLLKTAGEISLDKNIIDNLSQEDICNVSFMAGHEHLSESFK